jgi:hypothetical protein
LKQPASLLRKSYIGFLSADSHSVGIYKAIFSYIGEHNILQLKRYRLISEFCSNFEIRLLTFVLILLSLIIFSTNAYCQIDETPGVALSSPLAVGFESDFASRYIWHGLSFSDGAVSQNSIWISKWGLTGSIWSNYDFKIKADEPRFNELDLGLDYEKAFSKLNMKTSILNYNYPDQPDIPSTAEVALDLSYDLAVLQPFVINTFDIKEYQGAYFGEFGFRWSHAVTEKVSLDASTEVGWGSVKYNETYIGQSGFALELASGEISATWNLTTSLYLRPHLLITTLIDRKIKSLVEKPTLFQIGTVFGGEF